MNKPSRVTSHDVVAKVRRVLGRREVGHAGTLDPMATGLLVLLVGEATKISDYVLSGDKGYRLKVNLGFETNTLDTDGEITQRYSHRVSESEVIENANALQGEFDWPVPAYSAIKQDGHKLYELARSNKPVHVPQKAMRFWGLETIEVSPDHYDGRLLCSKGSYIRTWASQLGQRLGTGGTLSFLERFQSSPYSLENAVSLDDLEVKVADKTTFFNSSFYVPLNKSLPQFSSLYIKGKDEKLLLNGQVSFDLERRLLPDQKEANLSQKSQFFKVYGTESRLLGLIEILPFEAPRIKRVFKDF